MRRFLFIGVLSLLAATSSVAADIAVLPIQNRDGADNVTITELVRQSVVGFGLDVLSSADTAAVIADAAAIAGTCDVSTASCALQLGGVAGVSRVVVGTVTGTQVQLKLLDVATQAEVNASFVGVANNPGRAARLAAVRLLRPDLEMGGLYVSVDVAGANIIVDGAERGVSPTSTISLKPGRHEVYITHFDFESQTFAVDVDFAVTTQLNVTLDPAKRRAPASAGSADEELAEVSYTRVFVVDVVAPGADPLPLALATQAAVEQLQCLDGLLVVSPADLASLVDDEVGAALSACRTDACWTEGLLQRFGAGEVILIDADRHNGTVISGRRYDLEHGVLGANTGAVQGTEEAFITGTAQMARTLYPEPAVRSDVGCGEGLGRRVVPPPLTTQTFVVTAIASAAAGAVSGLALGVAVLSQDEGTAEGFGTVAIVTGVAAVAGALVSGLEAAYVDWDDLAGQNDQLVRDAVSRRVTRRLGPEQPRRRRAR